MNDRRAATWYATAARRLAVTAHVTLTVAIGGLMTHFFLAEGEPLWAMAVTAVLLLPWTVATGVINGATRGPLELRERALDERQSAERSRVLARSHRVTTLLLAAAAVSLLITGGTAVDAPKAYAAPLLIAVLVVHWVMPLWAAGLRAQDEPVDDDECAGAGGLGRWGSRLPGLWAVGALGGRDPRRTAFRPDQAAGKRAAAGCRLPAAGCRLASIAPVPTTPGARELAAGPAACERPQIPCHSGLLRYVCRK
ncbi:hypothetical protein SAMN06272771_5274 [Streptomyces sp. Ag82_O1-12]|nr:hypothetical protein SAMN06272771_5274 [Streptomyces sp. Ag82_O1-12]SOD47854.1 hypothetical protein SAMN06272727_5276 [Streptomyces sp. Ag82_G6-1]